jgi:hypothetical protein
LIFEEIADGSLNFTTSSPKATAGVVTLLIFFHDNIKKVGQPGARIA